MIQILATLCSGTFFGAALYINVAQHPATLDTGGEFPGRFFPPMYRRAAPMQIALALGGTAFGIIEWYISRLMVWLVGAVFLISVVPITLLFIKPINDRLLDPENNLTRQEIESLLRRWNPRHCIRSIVSGVSFLSYLVGMAS